MKATIGNRLKVLEFRRGSGQPTKDPLGFIRGDLLASGIEFGRDGLPTAESMANQDLSVIDRLGEPPEAA
jgi:hypothetical protein